MFLLKSPQDYISCAEAWIEYVCKHFTVSAAVVIQLLIIHSLIPMCSLSLLSEREIHVRTWEQVCDVLNFHAKSSKREGNACVRGWVIHISLLIYDGFFYLLPCPEFWAYKLFNP